MKPHSIKVFRFSWTTFSVMIGCILLAAILTVATVRNLNRAKQQMENFLTQEGIALVHTLEAGIRAAMRHRMQGDNPIDTLAKEVAREKAIAYIRISDNQGWQVSMAGDWVQSSDRPEVSQILSQALPITTFIKKSEIFEVAMRLQPLSMQEPDIKGMQQLLQQWCSPPDSATDITRQPASDLIVQLGLYTGEINDIHSQDARHNILMGILLFLVGAAGFFFLFLYQKMYIVKNTLIDMELYTKDVLESMPSGLMTLDNEGLLTSWNRKAEELIGHKLHKTPPTWTADFTGQQSQLGEIAIDCLHKNGPRIPIKVSSSQLHNQVGKVIGTVLMLRDMREIHEMEKRLERSRRLAALGRMAAAIAHEIRNPLGTLRGFAQYFGSLADADKNSRQYAGLMVGEVDRLNHTISALLQFARPREPDFQTVKLDDLLAKISLLLEKDFSSKKIAFSHTVHTNLQLVADSDLLLQVFLNLLQNSIAATPPDGKISLQAGQKENTIFITITDTGIGMTPEEREKMFDPFFTTKKSGTGLGLAVSHQIIEQHRGRFTVESSPGKGSKITITLPLTEHDNVT